MAEGGANAGGAFELAVAACALLLEGFVCLLRGCCVQKSPGWGHCTVELVLLAPGKEVRAFPDSKLSFGLFPFIYRLC